MSAATFDDDREVANDPYPALFIFVRHAQSQGNLLTPAERVRLEMGTPYYTLTDRGRAQARMTGEWLQKFFPNPDRIFRSYFVRTRETAELLYSNRSIAEDERLAEANRGMWHVLSEDDIREKMPWEIRRRELDGLYHYRPPGGENWPDVELRLRDFRRSMRRRFPGKTIVCVTHGHWLLLWQKRIDRWTIDETVERYKQGIIVENASVVIYRDEIVGGKHRLVHDPSRDYIVPWKGKL